MHVSDLHAGPPFDQEVAAVVIRQAREIQPDLLVISGDLVQRAIFPGQWRTIKDFLQALPQPQLVVPGNHDVPFFDGFSRIFFPMRYYHRHISTNLNPVFERPGLAVVGANTAHGLTIDRGHVAYSQRETLDSIFARFDADTCKIAVMHHPVIDPPAGRRGSKITNSREVLDIFERHGVEMLLCGHVHFSFIDESTGATSLPPGAMAAERRGIIICQSGTTTSRRGRGVDRGKNSFNLIDIDEQTIRIQPHFYVPTEQRFVATAERLFQRKRQPAH
jgi:3',5'-cyclic AMP phosphodiesterase CpdA